MDVFDRDAVAGVVVPDGKHTALDAGVLLFKLHTADVGRRPAVVEPLAVEIVIIIAGGRHDIDISVGDANELIALLFHIFGLRKTIIPATHQDVLRLDGSVAVGVSQ